VRRYWWWFRLVLFGVLFVGLGIYLFSTTPWQHWFGKKTDDVALRTQGAGIVHAIYVFRQEHALWPQYLEDLVPTYMDMQYLEPSSPAGGARWYYDLSSVSDDTAASGTRMLPSLSIRLPESARAHFGFDFDPDHPAWRYFGDTEPRDIPGVIGNLPPSLSPQQVFSNALAELDRRIVREPRDIEHRRGKAALLLSANRLAETRVVVDQSAADFPDSYWPRLASAVLDLQSAATSQPATLPAEPESLAAFRAWVKQKPSMTHWFYLSCLERLANRDDAAAAAMAQAAQQPVEVAADDPNISAYYLWDMARWALETRRLDLATQLTDSWEQADKDKRVADASYLSIRAATRLAQGNPAGAKLDLDALDGPPPAPPRRTWAKNLEGPSGLRDAITRNDRTYRYHPGPLPSPFKPFPLPE